MKPKVSGTNTATILRPGSKIGMLRRREEFNVMDKTPVQALCLTIQTRATDQVFWLFYEIFQKIAEFKTFLPD